MSNEQNDGGPAFPTTPVSHGYAPDVSGEGTGASPGMTLREYYAGQAIAGMLADENCNDSVENLAKGAVRCADALIAQLSAKSPLTIAVTETTAVRLAILIVNDIMTDGSNGAKAKRLLLETPGSLYPSKMSGWSDYALTERITGIIKTALQQANIE